MRVIAAALRPKNPRPLAGPNLMDVTGYVGNLERLQHALHSREEVRDEVFDAIYPIPYRIASEHFWTPVATARRAAELLVEAGACRVLDVGAGVGKFCIVGALTTERTTFVGIEHRAHLAEVASKSARRLGAHRAEFVYGSLKQMKKEPFDAYYFFNPFAENLNHAAHLDNSVPLSEARYHADLRVSDSMLASAPPRTAVVTYYGRGGKMPPGFKLVHSERSCDGTLRLWTKSA